MTELSIPTIKCDLDPEHLNPTLEALFHGLPATAQLKIHQAASEAMNRIPSALLSPIMLNAARKIVYSTAIEFAVYAYRLAGSQTTTGKGN